MRFAYIDSHGNEVPIPSVDALALRIELGAVGPDTQLYDAQADHWGPAKTHEIFHTLSRDSGEEGFVAPPPPVAPPPEPPQAKPAKPTAKPAAEKLTRPKSKPKKEAPPAAADLGLTLAAPPPDAPKPAKMPDPPLAGGFADLDLDLAPPDATVPPPSKGPAKGPAKSPPPPKAEEPAAGGGGFDFGDLGSGLELESTSAAGDLDLGSPMDFSGVGGAVGGGDDLMLETPMSEFSPESPPGWMEEPQSADDDVMDFSSVSAETAADEPAVATPRAMPGDDKRVPKDRPSKPKFKRQRSLSGPIVMVVILLALGVGGYVGWPILSPRISQLISRPEPTVRPPVVMPAISSELLQRMNELVDQSIADVVAAVNASTTPANAPSEPSRDWLAGVYLGNASQFAGIEDFWEGVGQLVDELRQGDPRSYHDALVARANAAGLSPEDAAIVVARADSGFVAAEDERHAAYDAMERLVLSSLDLHDFLVENEANIEYRPASSSTVDPVLEAVPASPAIGDRMWDMVDQITDALDALGSLDLVTRERLVTALRTRLQEVGVR